MKREILISAGVILSVLVLGVFVMAGLPEQDVGATVAVNEFLSVTLSDPVAPVDVAFGPLDQGDLDKPDLEQSVGRPAITMTNDPVSNVDVNIDVKGTDFSSASTGATIAVGAVTYDDDDIPSESVEMPNVEATLLTTYPGTPYYSGVTPSNSVGFWFFMDVPTPQKAATDYTSTFTFRAQS